MSSDVALGDGTGLKSAIADELESQLDDEQVGKRLGRELGARAGREVGARLGRTIAGAVRDGVERGKRPTEIYGDVKRTLSASVVESLGDRESLEDTFSALQRSLDVPDDVVGSIRETTNEATSGFGEGATDQATDAEEQATEGDGTGDQPDPDRVRRETYRELLEAVSYRELQSMAKEANIKANQRTEELVDALVDQFDEADDSVGTD